LNRCDIHTTTPTLLERLRQTGDETAWRRLVQLYTPLLFSWARRAGESDHDAADLVQEVFVALVQVLPTFTYARQNGQFRSWLRTLLLNKLRDRKRRQLRLANALAQVPLEVVLPDDVEAFWDNEGRQELIRRAMRLMETDFAPTTWKACWETVVQGRSSADVGRELGMTENSVNVAKCRVLRRLRQELKDLVD
jgi:RNA polymerase sigma-70 factor (ECF subfamily)